MKVKNVSELIGHTPILAAEKYLKSISNVDAKLYVKLEYFNPTGSIKDRASLAMINDAEEKGLLKKGGTIIEPTSGNTGIGLASIAAQRGYRLILTMPETMSVERRNILKAYGAEIVLTDGEKGMSGSIEKAQEIKNNTTNSIILGQFDNMANVKANEETTGLEIWEDVGNDIDTFISCVGTGGTFTGISKFLKSKNQNIKTVAVEPYESAVLSGEKAGPHKIQGIGANFIPSILDVKLIDKIVKVNFDESIKEAKNFALKEGALVGISSGCALAAAKKIIEEGYGKKIIVILPDSADRYMSTELFEF